MGTTGDLKQLWIILLILCILFEPLACKRGGSSKGRGSSSARSSSAGSGGSRSSGGIGGSSGKTGGSSSIGRGGSSSRGGIVGGSSGKTGGSSSTGSGGSRSSGGIGGSSGKTGGSSSIGRGGSSSSGGIIGGSSGRNTGGGIFGGSSGRNTGGGIFGGSSGRNTGGGIFRGNSGQNRRKTTIKIPTTTTKRPTTTKIPTTTTTKRPTTTTTKNAYSGGNSGWESGGHKYTKGSGVGSFVRSNTFKNAIVGAAAGHLIYQGGKYMIRSVTAPMMWSNRQYYWGEQYYQSRPGNQMCRMPIDPTDQHFGNVYFQNQTRPREIVWGCGAGEVCCGTECCHVNGESGWEDGVVGLLYAALTPDVSNLLMLSGGNSGWESGGHKYTKGSGVGSFDRSNTFKNAIVDTAAGHLIYHGGKHMIQNATAPMMWSNRQYYWGEQYYQSRPGNQMCHMPINPTDQQLGNVYFQNQTRPHEIVWGCGACEVCCGTECCQVNDESGWEKYVFGLLYGALTPDVSNLTMLV